MRRTTDGVLGFFDRLMLSVSFGNPKCLLGQGWFNAALEQSLVPEKKHCIRFRITESRTCLVCQKCEEVMR